jgi:hypothetical protein
MKLSGLRECGRHRFVSRRLERDPVAGWVGRPDVRLHHRNPIPKVETLRSILVRKQRRKHKV